MMAQSNPLVAPIGLGLGLGKAAGFGVGDGTGPLLLHASGPASATTAAPIGVLLTKLGTASTLIAGAGLVGLLVVTGIPALAGYLTYRLVKGIVQ